MSNAPIPNQVDPRRFADRALSFQGQFPQSCFARLAELVTRTDGEVKVSLSFLRDEQKLVVVRMSMSTQVVMTCQRCLEDALLPVGGDYQYVVIRPGSDTSLIPQEYDIIELDDEPLDVRALVEEELLLCLPIVPKHPDDACEHPQGYVEAELNGEEVARSNPFSVLAQLRKP
ncbi:MAG: metal-binding protein [Gammaproteobacteria bacterium]|nr:metal-binding protein [Gammaproteobacteria bacterium]